MNNLSLAAQAVLDAYQFAPIEDELTAAAVLRAAVAVTQQYQGNGCLSDEIWTCDADELLAIADELDDVKYGTYRSNLSDKPK
jgi:hypothetical protein